VSPPPDAGGSNAGGPDAGTVRWRLRLAYDGAGFHGFAANDGQRTVAGVLGEALERVARAPVVLTCAGRTDTGVHALDQVVHFDLPAAASARLEPAALVRSCNSQLAPAIVVREAAPADPGFDARRSARSRRYRYLVVNGPVADPLLAPLSWHVFDPLDLRSMAAAADALVGEHDFRAFCRRTPGAAADAPLVRRVADARWSRLGDSPRPPTGTAPSAWCDQGVPMPLLPAVGHLLSFEIEANAFCHRMVRSLVGTLVDVGRGRRRAADLVWILRSCDRSQAAQPAPAHGLTLVAVHY
jgi:tRNA pseudouridine38-40 synthase